MEPGRGQYADGENLGCRLWGKEEGSWRQHLLRGLGEAAKGSPSRG